MSVPASRLHLLRDLPVSSDGAYVLYWMTASRRLEWSFALDRAAQLAREAGRPLLILEALRIDYPWASERQHRFAVDGMVEHARRLAGSPVGYWPYLEPEPGAGSGLLEALAEHACAVVADTYPAFFLPRMVEAAARRLPVRLEAVDANGLLPLEVADRTFTAAYHFRRFLQKRLPDHLLEMPSAEPVEGRGLPRFPNDLSPAASSTFPESAGTALRAIAARWPPARLSRPDDPTASLKTLALDRTVPAGPAGGGRPEALGVLRRFLDERLAGYAEARNHPDAEATSELSPYLHWGHLSVHEVFARVAAAESWSPARISDRADGRRSGWWGMGADAEAFLDQLVTWRELGFVFCHREPHYHRWETLPSWAIATLEAHSADPRPTSYTPAQLEAAETHDEVWNAAQRQLVREGVLHNYLRMLWGKKILEWSPHPRDALDVMVHLNNRWALDGRDPNSYSGIFWTLGRFDRGWPERPVYGKVRSMSSERTRKKVRMERYLVRYGA